MDAWTHPLARRRVFAFDTLTVNQQDVLIKLLNERFPPSVYEIHRRKRRQAQQNLKEGRQVLEGASQKFPHFIESTTVSANPESLVGIGIVLTAGGEGERLRLSLQKRGVPESALDGFTKATFPLPGFFEDFGALQINMALMADISARFQMEVPVVVTTGPAGTATSRVVTDVIEQHKAFGVKNATIVCQGERLHLTADEQIAVEIRGATPYPVTHPDETGGPIMKLKAVEPGAGQSALDWFAAHGADKIMILQGTAVYHPDLIPVMAEAARNHDGLGVGILRSRFDVNDPFGSFVVLKTPAKEQLVIVEQEVRNARTCTLMDSKRRFFLPYNTGFYVFDSDVLRKNDLPDYATPPKEVLPGLPRSPKIGYAATDILSLTRKPAVLTIPPDYYGVVKQADDLNRLTDMAKRFGLDAICRRAMNRLNSK